MSHVAQNGEGDTSSKQTSPCVDKASDNCISEKDICRLLSWMFGFELLFKEKLT